MAIDWLNFRRKMDNLYIGLMSGTSADGIDAALVDFKRERPHLIDYFYEPYPEAIRSEILALSLAGKNEIERLSVLDHLLGKAYAQTVNQLLQKTKMHPHEIKAIGSHGQTIRHAPNHQSKFTLQIGDPNIIAALTSITTVADFRRKDMALGGQGAPLVPAFHHHVLQPTKSDRAIVNIGGIANVTILKKDKPDEVIGFDTGPGNALMDAWIHEHLNKHYDDGGCFASQGTINHDLLKEMLNDNYFCRSYPKSTGREYFNLSWLKQITRKHLEKLAACDVQSTLLELTAQSIIFSIRKILSDGEILICGGGAKNNYLLERLSELGKPNFAVKTTAAYGIPPDWMEAMAFAWLALRTINKQTGNLASVTGAKYNSILGAIYYP